MKKTSWGDFHKMEKIIKGGFVFGVCWGYET